MLKECNGKVSQNFILKVAQFDRKGITKDIYSDSRISRISITIAKCQGVSSYGTLLDRVYAIPKRIPLLKSLPRSAPFSNFTPAVTVL